VGRVCGTITILPDRGGGGHSQRDHPHRGILHLPLRAARVLLLSALLLPAGCADPPASDPSAPLQTSFLPDKPDTVEVKLLGSQPVASAELIDSESNHLPVATIAHGEESLTATAQPETGKPGPSPVLAPASASSPPPVERRVTSRFTIKIPNMEAYRANWDRWKFHLVMADAREMEFQAPKPPARQVPSYGKHRGVSLSGSTTHESNGGEKRPPQ
jgi:hypothetical protein